MNISTQKVSTSEHLSDSPLRMQRKLFSNSPRPAGTRANVHSTDAKPLGSVFSLQSNTWSRASPAASTGSDRHCEGTLKGGSSL